MFYDGLHYLICYTIGVWFAENFSRTDDDSGVRRMKTEMLNSLRRRYSDMEATDCLALATIIDLRFKNKSFRPSEVKGLSQERHKE